MKYVYIKAIKLILKSFHPSIAQLIKNGPHNYDYTPHASNVPQM